MLTQELHQSKPTEIERVIEILTHHSRTINNNRINKPADTETAIIHIGTPFDLEASLSGKISVQIWKIKNIIKTWETINFWGLD